MCCLLFPGSFFSTEAEEEPPRNQLQTQADEFFVELGELNKSRFFPTESVTARAQGPLGVLQCRVGLGCPLRSSVQDRVLETAVKLGDFSVFLAKFGTYIISLHMVISFEV